ncbi:cell wall-binding repeat-containing protein [Haloimpatiens sp. FM7330]|uniref:cell wall-binding repeat-containing protein n=1 Tax=Haloimpatiens sp. FM7330 TaxID=3298610 RepID=UPI00363D1090
MDRRKLLLFVSSFIYLMFLIVYKVSAAPVTVRFAGSNRYKTSVEISKNNWSTSDYVILASGEDFPDALSAAPLAKKYNAPILLIENNSMNSDIVQEIQRLGANNAFIVGGTGVISENVENQLGNLNIVYTRIQGEDRYETSVKIAEIIGTNSGVVIASGENFPDALSIASIAAQNQMPILLTQKNVLPTVVDDFIKNNSSNKYYVIGGKAVVSDEVVNGLSNLKRLSGSNRYETNLAVINEFLSGINKENVYVATGQAFPDALAGSAAAAKTSSMIVLTNDFHTSTNSIVESNLQSISNIKILGGTSRISDELINKTIYGRKTSRVVLGYTAYYYHGDTVSYNSIVANSDLIDKIATATYSVDSSGNLSGGAPTNQMTYSNDNGIETLVMISNEFSGKVASSILRSSTNRQNLINNILKVMKDNNYKGVNIDLEGVYYYDRSYYTTFMKELYNTLNPQGFKVTAAIPAKTRDNPSDGWSGAFDYAEIQKYTHQILIMTYDEHWFGGEPGPIASIGWVENVIKYALTVIPKEKILVGVAAYGYDWASSGTKAHSIGQAYSTASKYGASVKWDYASKTPYYYYTDSSGIKHTVWFENDTSLGYKLDLVNKYDLCGIGIWRLGLENTYYWDKIELKFK